MAEAKRMIATRKTETEMDRILDDPITGLLVLSAGPDAPLLTSEEVEEILAIFP
jgi:hypothetical protein